MVSVIIIDIPDKVERVNVVIALAHSGYKVWFSGSVVHFEIGKPLPKNRPVIGNYRNKGEIDGI